MRARCLIPIVLIVLTVLPAMAAPRTFVAATGLSTKTEVMAAADEATKAMLARFAAMGDTPTAVIFLERVKGVTNADAARVGDAVKALAGVPTYGTGGTCADSLYGHCWGEGVTATDSTFLVLGLAGEGLAISAGATGGEVEYTWDKAPEAMPKHRSARAFCEARGRALAAQVPALARPGFVLFLGAQHNWWHTYMARELHNGLGPAVPLVGGVGTFSDYVYVDGRALTDPAGRPTTIGQLAIVV